MKLLPGIALLMTCTTLLFGQTKEAYDREGEGSGFLDPSRLTISHAMSFGMASGAYTSGLQSQSVYSTMMQYRFAAPVTLNLNFDLPLHSTFSPYNNMTSENMQSLEYFKNMPFDVSLSWKPSDKFHMMFSVVKFPANYGYYNGYYNDGSMTMGRPLFRP